MHAHWFTDDSRDGVPRVQRRVGILEHHLHATPQRAQRTFAQVSDVAPVEDDAPVVRLVEAQDRASDRRLAASRLADEPERLTAADLKRDVVDCANVADVAVEHEPALDCEVHLEPLELDERAAVAAHAVVTARSCAQRSTGTGLKHATK